jgi:hypothetical protein
MAQARELLREGLDQRDKGDAVGALDKLKAAHALAHTPITGLELGQTYLKLAELVEAREVFISSAHMPMRNGETSRSASARSQSETLAEQLRSRIPSVSIKVTGVSPDSVALTIDGAVVPTEALEAPRFVNPGSHAIAARSTAGGAAETRVDLKEGESRDVELRIVLTGGTPSEASTATASAPTAATRPLEGQPETSRPRSHVLDWSLMGAGAAIAIAGGVVMGVEASQGSDAVNHQDRAAYDSARNVWIGGLVGTLVGGVVFVSGGVLFASTAEAKPATAGTNSVWFGMGINSMTLGGTW